MFSAAFILLVPLSPAAPPAPPKGQRIALTDGQLFIPEGFRAGDKSFNLYLHLHGAANVTEANFARSGHSGVLVTVVIPGLSSVYAKHFQDGKSFPRILDEAQAKLTEQKLVDKPAFARVIVSSFSADYGGVREMLKDGSIFNRIDVLMLADTIYASYAGDPAQHHVNAEQMAGFLKFAKLAAEGKKWMILSHCDLQPDGYASTGETADYLIAELKGKREKAAVEWPAERLKLQSQFRSKQLEIYGFTGATGADHMHHLQEIWALWQRLPKN
ncbi:MAG TPA: hypothetical protein VKS79_15385 [Gemmataceae bacterium]|nr:hypothetical protein [Gemmataceae bacterium]